MRLVGIGYRYPISQWILSHPKEIDCVEITAEHFFGRNLEILSDLANKYPLLMHGLGLSLGTPGPLDQSQLLQFSSICKLVQPVYISEHIAFTKSQSVDLGHLNPIQFNKQNLELMTEHVNEVQDTCQQQLIMENITSHLTLPHTLHETTFMNELCQRTGCGLLLDITNLYINAKNHHFDALEWLHSIEPAFIKQIHIVGFSHVENRFEDNHAEFVQSSLLELLKTAVRHSPVNYIILERDKNFPATEALAKELIEIRNATALH